MEEFDDELQEPNEKGELVLAHRAWGLLDDIIWSWYVHDVTHPLHCFAV